MTTIKIVKGLPISFVIGVTNNDITVDLNDGDWSSIVELRLNTVTGPSAFSIIATPAGTGYLVELDGAQTSQLDSRAIGYVLVIKSSNTDETVFLRNTIPVSIVNDI